MATADASQNLVSGDLLEVLLSILRGEMYSAVVVDAITVLWYVEWDETDGLSAEWETEGRARSFRVTVESLLSETKFNADGGDFTVKGTDGQHYNLRFVDFVTAYSLGPYMRVHKNQG